jgi:3-hydroxyisobutyrate dehydrogenase
MTAALFGTGLLGGAIAQRLLQCGQDLWVWNRSPDRAEPLRAIGAKQASTARETAEQARWLITVLSDGPSTRALLVEQINTGLQGRTVIQMGTIGPEESRGLAEAVRERGGRYLEAPVLGSKPEALAGNLQLMAGGPRELFEQALPLLRQLSPSPVHMGDVGTAIATKLALNQLIASLTHAFSLSLHLVQRSGVEVQTFMDLLRSSALYAPTFDKKLDRELKGDYGNPNFPTAHLRKDLALFQAAGQSAGLETQGLDGLLTLLGQATAAGLDSLDYCALHALTAGRTTAAEQG